MITELEYSEFLRATLQTFSTRARDLHFIYSVDTSALWSAYLDGFAPEERCAYNSSNKVYRDTYNCRTCRQFIERFGGLVKIENDGTLTSLLWDPFAVPSAFSEIVTKLAYLVERGTATAVLDVANHQWWLGVPRTGEWNHLAVWNGQSRHKIPTDLPTRLELIRNRWPSRDVRRKALALFLSGRLTRDERFVPILEWHERLDVALELMSNRRMHTNLLMRFATQAPEGWLNLRSSVLSTIFESIERGESFYQLERRFVKLTDGTNYMRPKAAPASGTIDAAEKLVSELGLQRSFARRFATVDELPSIWLWKTSPSGESIPGGMFTILRDTTPLPQQTVGEIKLTWASFKKRYLDNVETLEVWTKSRDHYAAYTTAVHFDAPPLFQWDRPEYRNPVAMYQYSKGSDTSRWRLPTGTWVTVTAIHGAPHEWSTGDFSKFGSSVLFALKGAEDTDPSDLALFPEILRGELHAVRSVIEAYSKRGRIQPAPSVGRLASGILVGQNYTDVRIRVKIGGVISRIHLDRWE